MVVVRANGVPTYFAADIAYHKDKFKQGFDWVINVWERTITATWPA